MIKETALVTSADATTAWVKTRRSEACESCSAKDSCGTSSNFEEVTIKVDNTINVKAGDSVVIGVETKPMLFLTFLLYVFPIIFLIAGALIGNWLAGSFAVDPSFLSMAAGFSLFGISILIIRKKSRSLSRSNQYKPFLIKKKPAFNIK